MSRWWSEEPLEPAQTIAVPEGARASFVSVTDVPSVLDLDEVLSGTEPGSPQWSAAVEVAADVVRGHVQPETDIHATAEYRRMLVGELTRRVLHESVTAAAGARDG